MPRLTGVAVAASGFETSQLSLCTSQPLAQLSRDAVRIEPCDRRTQLLYLRLQDHMSTRSGVDR
jgi:hypothetical protein